MSISLNSSADELDKYDRLPIVSTLFSAPLRAGIALVQIVAGAFFAAISAGEYLFTRNERLCNVTKGNLMEIRSGFENLSRAFVAFIPFAGNMILANRPSRVVLTRDSDGYYTIPSHAKIPGVPFGKYACMRSREFLIRQGDTIMLDTKGKILPPGWEIRN